MFRSPSVIYIHGFGSTCNSKKAHYLSKKLEEKKIRFIGETYNCYDPDEAHKELNEIVKKEKNRGSKDIIFCGTSIGGFWAKNLAIEHEAYFVAANPSLNPQKSLEKYLRPNGLYTDFLGNHYTFNRDMVDKYGEYRTKYDLMGKKYKNGSLLLCTGDEILSSTWPKIVEQYRDSCFVDMISGGNHRFEDNDRLLEEILKYTRV